MLWVLRQWQPGCLKLTIGAIGVFLLIRRRSESSLAACSHLSSLEQQYSVCCGLDFFALWSLGNNGGIYSIMIYMERIFTGMRGIDAAFLQKHGLVSPSRCVTMPHLIMPFERWTNCRQPAHDFGWNAKKLNGVCASRWSWLISSIISLDPSCSLPAIENEVKPRRKAKVLTKYFCWYLLDWRAHLTGTKKLRGCTKMSLAENSSPANVNARRICMKN